MDLGDKIKMLRIQQGLTLEEVGERVGVGKSTVRKWENGQIANMRRDKIALVAKALNVAPSFLMGWTDDASGGYSISGYCNPRPVWNERFSEAVSSVLSEYDQADCDAAGVDRHAIENAMEKGSALRFDDACEIADQLGISLDEDVMERTELAAHDEPQRNEFIQLFSHLSPEQRQIVLGVMRGFLGSPSQSNAPQE